MKKEPQPSFKSIQILGTKAHEIWTKARAAKQAQKKASNTAEGAEAEMPGADLTIAITLSSVVKATLAIFAIYLGAQFLFTIRDKIFILCLAFFLSIVIDSSVSFLERMRIPRGFAVLLVYILFLSVLIFLVASLIPIVAYQVQDLARLINRSADDFLATPDVQIPLVSDAINAQLSSLMHNLLEGLQIKDRTDAMTQFGANLSLAAQNSFGFAVQLAGSVFNFIATSILILFLTFFIQMEKEKISNYFRIFFPRHYRRYVDAKAEAVYLKMSQWAQGQIILCFSIGLMAFIALKILGMPYALTLALLAGFTEIIPYAGPIIAAVPAVLIAGTQGGFVWAVITMGIYYAIQFCENHILVPLVMKHAVGLSPIVVMFGMLVAVSFPSTIHPILGVILAVPVTTIVAIFIDDLRHISRKKVD
ncbi:MAG: AI-2E family transporter [Candidatus Peribacteraceae bacterium]|nr:AI-2E family transporter [Candidatus Peribacteraceae bacterium]